MNTIKVMDDWPDCPIPECPNKVCLALNSKFCFPHTPGNERVKRIDIDVRSVMDQTKGAPL